MIFSMPPRAAFIRRKFMGPACLWRMKCILSKTPSTRLFFVRRAKGNELSRTTPVALSASIRRLRPRTFSSNGNASGATGSYSSPTGLSLGIVTSRTWENYDSEPGAAS